MIDARVVSYERGTPVTPWWGGGCRQHPPFARRPPVGLHLGPYGGPMVGGRYPYNTAVGAGGIVLLRGARRRAPRRDAQR